MNRQEHNYIEEYLKGELDWELLVDAVGEDMARGVRIAENFYKKNSKLSNIEYFSDRIVEEFIDSFEDHKKFTEIYREEIVN